MKQFFTILFASILFIFLFFSSAQKTQALWSQYFDTACYVGSMTDPCSFGYFNSKTCEPASIPCQIGVGCGLKNGYQCVGQQFSPWKDFQQCVNTNDLHDTDGTVVGTQSCSLNPGGLHGFQFYAPPTPTPTPTGHPAEKQQCNSTGTAWVTIASNVCVAASSCSNPLPTPTLTPIPPTPTPTPTRTPTPTSIPTPTSTPVCVPNSIRYVCSTNSCSL